MTPIERKARELLPCGECGMPCSPGEYHPFAACLMFKACKNSEQVRSNLAAILSGRGGRTALTPPAGGLPDPSGLRHLDAAMTNPMTPIERKARELLAADAVTGISPTTDYLRGLNAALHAIAELPSSDVEAQTNGHEDAYRAVEALAKAAPEANPEAAALQMNSATCPECKAGVLYECPACSSNNYPPPAAKFKLGDRVTKTKGSSWTGRVVGTYSTTLTPEGYAVESETETGSVQIYPAAALEET